MNMIDPQSLARLRDIFSHLISPVRLILFTEEDGSGYNRETYELLTEISKITRFIELERHDTIRSPELAARFRVTTAPCLIVAGTEDIGFRFVGIPVGHIFGTLIDLIIDVGTDRASQLLPDTIKTIGNLDTHVHMQVFFTPSCPHCPPTVRQAQLFALASPRITVDCIEATEFPELVRKHGIRGVPMTLINGCYEFVGALSEQEVLDHLQAAIAPQAEEISG
jgi:glutaredoxin-like protein